MDHTEATAEQLVEKYVLDELEDEKAERFEEHYFECADCATDLRSAVTLMRYGAELPAEPATNVVPIATGSRFKSWLATAAAAAIGFIVAVPMFRAPAPVPGLIKVHEVIVEAQSRDASKVEEIVVEKDEQVTFVIDAVPGVTEYDVTVRSTDGRITPRAMRVTARPDSYTVLVAAPHLPSGTYVVAAPPAATKTIRVIRKEGKS
jgi:anti-sigma factor RsiW